MATPPVKWYYGVRVGKVPGVYDCWGDANDQTFNFTGQCKQKFRTYEEAQRFVEGGQGLVARPLPGVRGGWVDGRERSNSTGSVQFHRLNCAPLGRKRPLAAVLGSLDDRDEVEALIGGPSHQSKSKRVKRESMSSDGSLSEGEEEQLMRLLARKKERNIRHPARAASRVRRLLADVESDAVDRDIDSFDRELQSRELHLSAAVSTVANGSKSSCEAVLSERGVAEEHPSGELTQSVPAGSVGEISIQEGEDSDGEKAGAQDNGQDSPGTAPIRLMNGKEDAINEGGDGSDADGKQDKDPESSGTPPPSA